MFSRFINIWKAVSLFVLSTSFHFIWFMSFTPLLCAIFFLWVPLPNAFQNVYCDALFFIFLETHRHRIIWNIMFIALCMLKCMKRMKKNKHKVKSSIYEEYTLKRIYFIFFFLLCSIFPFFLPWIIRTTPSLCCTSWRTEPSSFLLSIWAIQWSLHYNHICAPGGLNFTPPFQRILKIQMWDVSLAPCFWRRRKIIRIWVFSNARKYTQNFESIYFTKVPSNLTKISSIPIEKAGACLLSSFFICSSYW